MQSKEELMETLGEFFRENNIKKVISISGGSDEKKDIVEGIIEEAIREISPYEVAILTGGTRWGVPGISSEIAHKYGLPTIGVFPERGEKDSKRYNIDHMVIVRPRYGPSEFGDESEIFVKIPDGMIIIGGGFGTLIEIAHVLKMLERRIKPKYNEGYPIVVPIEGIGGSSGLTEKLSQLSKETDVRSILPPNAINTGKEAALYLIERLKLEDYKK